MRFPPEATGRIGDFVSFDKGKAPTETYDAPGNGRLPYLSPEYLRGDAPPLYIVPTDRDVLVEEGDPIVLWDGSNAGEVFFAKTGVLASTMTRVLPKNEEVKRIYLGQVLKFHEGYLRALTAGSGIPHADKAIVKRLPFWKASVAEQKTVGEALLLVDSSIQVVRASIAKAERLQKGLMRQLLTGRIKPDGAARAKEELCQTKLGLMPKSWRIFKAKDCCAKVTDGTHDTPRPANEGYPLLTSKNLTGNGIDLSDIYLITKEDYDAANQRSKVHQYDILYAMIGTIGNPEIVEDSEVQYAVKNVGIFKTGGNRVLAVWIRNYLRSPIYLSYLHRQQAGTTQQFISLGYLRKLLIPFPATKDGAIDWKQVEAINDSLQAVDNLCRAKRLKNIALQRLKKSLMQNLLTGRIRLPVEELAKETDE